VREDLAVESVGIESDRRRMFATFFRNSGIRSGRSV
jgi:hypothetical protein